MSEVFSLMDAHGLPLDTIQDLLAERGMAFNVQAFCQAAIQSGNYTADSILERLRQCAPAGVPDELLRFTVNQATK